MMGWGFLLRKDFFGDSLCELLEPGWREWHGGGIEAKRNVGYICNRRLREFVIIGDLVAKWLNLLKRFKVEKV